MTAPTLTRPAAAEISPATRAWAAFAQIEESPDQWEQGNYRTRIGGGHAYDFAGWVLRLDAGRWFAQSRWYLHAQDSDPAKHIGMVDGAPLVHARDRIRRLLDLDLDGMRMLVDDLEETDLERLRTRIVETFGEVA